MPLGERIMRPWTDVSARRTHAKSVAVVSHKILESELRGTHMCFKVEWKSKVSEALFGGLNFRLFFD